MAKILRKTQKIFASNATTAEITTFGTAMTVSPNNSRDLDDIQNANFLAGWSSAIQADKAPYEEDTNGLCYAITTQLAYLFQQGVAEWDAGTTYQLNSICTVVEDGLLIMKRSLSNENINNDPLEDNGTNWTDYYSQRVIHTIGDPIFTLNPVKTDDEVWLDGSSKSRDLYADLFAIYGTTYGAVDEDHFNLPNFRDKTIWGLPENDTLGYISAGLPNIKGSIWYNNNSNEGLNSDRVYGAFTRVQVSNNQGSEGDGTHSTQYTFNANDGASYVSAENAGIYNDNCHTVQPPAIKVRVKTRWR